MAQLAALWALCARPLPGDATGDAPEPAAPGLAELPAAGDVDLLSVIDHRMRWYAEDEPALHRALEAVVSQRERSFFVGASMGGFGALLHGSRLADAVLALGPQSRLDQAILRPPAPDAAGLRELSARATAAVLAGRRRGAALEVHCAADEHFWHALNLPLADGAVTVHPLMPRKPFARLLDSVSLLQPILADAVQRVMQRPKAARGDAEQAEDGEALRPGGEAPAASSRLLLARWGRGGALERRHAGRAELLRLFFRAGAPSVPRPDDWFCPRCAGRNMVKQFFCHACGPGVAGANVAAQGVIKVPGPRGYPQAGDWGCGACGTAVARNEFACAKCGKTAKEHPQSLVVGA